VGDWLMSGLDATLQAALLVTLWVVVTGGLHLDGLSDVADAWMGGLKSKQRTLEIMQDSRAGAIAIVVVSLTLILKVTTLATYHSWVVLLVAPVAARAMIIPVFLWVPCAKQDGLAADLQIALTEQKRKWCAGILAVSAFAPVFFVSFWLWVSLVVVSFVVFLIWRMAMIRRLQGFTGDCVGALIEITELALLLTFAIFGAAA